MDRIILANGFLVLTKFGITDVTAPTLARSFGNILSKRGWDNEEDAVIHFFT